MIYLRSMYRKYFKREDGLLMVQFKQKNYAWSEKSRDSQNETVALENYKVCNTENFKSLVPGIHLRSHILKQTCGFQVKVSLSMSDLLVNPRH